MWDRYQSNPGIDHWKTTKKVLRYLQGTKDYMLTYKRSDHFEVIDYLDSDYVGCVDSKNYTFGYIFLLTEGVVSWKTAKQFMIATSTVETLSHALRPHFKHYGCETLLQDLVLLTI
uniref:Retrovirus-related Pol polyprotein from transposon TNT 1-94 n=1 Tax=Cajanus cajan TaxID=3821 RepID=A0A151TYT1_CAJCA|nr:Retrovirus-related Pol polyprotein from transposon TNT 1-94 [Cajanus cajan]